MQKNIFLQNILLPGCELWPPGRYQEAVDAYKQAIRLNADLVEAHYYDPALDYLSLGDKESALEDYKILKDLDKEKANKLFNLIYK